MGSPSTQTGIARYFAARQCSDSYPASENIKRETSSEEAENAREVMEEMSEIYRKNGKQLYVPMESDS